jgi:O-antigen/teichoic acid export membrane protein
VYSAVKLAAVVLLVGVWLSVSGALVANMLASLGALAYVMSRLSIRMGRPSAAAWAPLIRLALPLGLYMLAFQTIANLDLWSLTALDHARDADTIGLYVAARNVAVVPGVILMVVSDVLLPLLSGAVAAGNAPLSRGYVQGAVRFLSILVVPIAVVLALAADDIMTVLYSGRFRPAGAYARVLVLYAVSLPFMDLFASALSARGEPYRGGVTLLLVVPLAAISNVVFIGWYGAVGAAYASALAGVTATVVLGVLVVRRFGPLFTWRTLSNTAVAATMTALLARQFAAAESHLVLAAFGCVAVYGLMLIVLREIRAADLEPFAFWRSCRT